LKKENPFSFKKGFAVLEILNKIKHNQYLLERVDCGDERELLASIVYA